MVGTLKKRSNILHCKYCFQGVLKLEKEPTKDTLFQDPLILFQDKGEMGQKVQFPILITIIKSFRRQVSVGNNGLLFCYRIFSGNDRARLQVS